jgi:hypothetical protein
VQDGDDWFIEGFDVPDLKEVGALAKSWRSASSR